MARKILRPTKKQPFLIRNEGLLQQKREAVVEAAFALFLKEGFHRTTTRAIARQAGISAGAPFTYFKDKEEILFYIVSKEQDLATEQLISALSRQIAEATHNGTDPEEVFKTVFTTFLHAVDVMRRFILLAYQETKSLNTETRRALIAREKTAPGTDRRSNSLWSRTRAFFLRQHRTQGTQHYGFSPCLGHSSLGVRWRN